MVARFCVSQWPMASKFKNKVFASRLILLIMIMTISICILVITYFYGIIYSHVPSGMCLLLYTGTKCSYFVKFVSLKIICVQTICLISNVTLHLLTRRTLTNENESMLSCTRHRNKQVKIYLLIINITNICCWIPSSIVFIMPIIGYEVTKSLLAWIIILIIPINFVFDPLILTILTPKRRQELISLWAALLIKLGWKS